MVAEEYQDGWMRGINLRDLQVRGGARSVCVPGGQCLNIPSCIGDIAKNISVID